MQTPEISTTANGMRVATLSMPWLETVSLGIWVDAGARHEAEAENGIAHFLEHMAFKGTSRRSARDIAEAFDAIGGNSNAYTAMEQTAYHAKVLKEDVGTAVDILSDILVDSQFPQDELERERLVVLQEIAMQQDTPDDLVYDYFCATAYPGQPMGRSILGPPERVSRFERADLHHYIARHYGAERMILAAAGNLEHTHLVRLAEEHLARIPSGKPLPAVETARYVGGETRVTMDFEQTQVILGFPACTALDPDIRTFQLLALMLGGGMSSRLFQEVREKRGLAYNIGCFLSPMQDTGMFAIAAATAPQDTETLLAVVREELERFGRTVTPEELRRAKAQARASLLMGEESPSGQVENLARHLFTHGEAIPMERILADIHAVEIDRIRTVIDRLLGCETPTLAVLGR